MNIKEYTTHEALLRNSFLWSEARLVVAAVALLIGGVPPVMYFNPFIGLYGLLSDFLTLSWIISGLTAGYLLYRWNDGKRVLFGGRKELDTATFLVLAVSGLNLGIVGVFGWNIGMSVTSSYFIFVIVALSYLWSAGYLLKRWKESGKNMAGKFFNLCAAGQAAFCRAGVILRIF